MISEVFQSMYLMLQQDKPDDYAIATGISHKLEDFVATAFAEFKLDWREHVVIDKSLSLTAIHFITSNKAIF